MKGQKTFFSLKRQQGFTIAEAMISFAIFGLGIVGYIQAQFKALDNAVDNGNRVQATILVNDMVARIQANHDVAKKTINQDPTAVISYSPNSVARSVNNCQTLNSISPGVSFTRTVNTGGGSVSGSYAVGSYYNWGVVYSPTQAVAKTPDPACYGYNDRLSTWSAGSSGHYFSCCPGQMAEHDIYDWGLTVKTALPYATAVVCLDDNFSPKSTGCTWTGATDWGNPSRTDAVVFSVAVFWTNKANVQQSVVGFANVP